MSGSDDRSGFYRHEAEGCRRLTRLIAHPEIAAVLLALAEDFERKAGRIAKSNAEEPGNRRVNP